jgi:CO/xanthine dehydrogenase Mo-binding subunit
VQKPGKEQNERIFHNRQTDTQRGWTGKVTGEARYTIDMTLPNMLYGKLLRSPYPHAKIIKIDSSEAEKLPGVKAIITGKDTPGGKWGLWRRFRELSDQQALATDKVRFIGDPVAAVAATTDEIAEKALDLIEVEYEPLPAVFDPIEAIKDDAPMVHEDFCIIVGSRTGAVARRKVLVCIQGFPYRARLAPTVAPSPAPREAAPKIPQRLPLRSPQTSLRLFRELRCCASPADRLL